MKKIFILNILVLLVSFSFAQKQAISVIHGFIRNNKSPFITIEDTLLQLSPEGSFNFKRTLNHPRVFDIRYKENQFEVFLKPGDTIEFVMNDLDQNIHITFKGDLPETNRFLYHKSRIDKKLTDYFNINTIKWHDLYRKKEPDFLNKIDSLRNLYLIPFEELKKKNEKLNKKFLFVTEKNIKFTFDWLIFYYPYFHQKFTGEKAKLSKETQAYLNKIDLDNPSLIEIDEYSRFGKEVLRPQVRKEFKNNKSLKQSDNQWLQAALNVISNNFKHQETIDFWRYQYLKDHIENNGIKNIEPFMKTFNSQCNNDQLKSNLNQLYTKEKENRENHPVRSYKTINDFELDAHIFIPEDIKEEEKRPALVYFHGGSWSEGKPDWHFGPSEFGFVKICIEYRTYDRYGVLPFEAISDAKSAIRWIRKNGEELHTDTNKIIAAGNSAGGHLALTTALLDTLDEPGENKQISSKPNALILNAAVYDLKGCWFEYLVEDKEKITAISPLHNIKKGLPPMLIFHGKSDTQSSPYKNCKKFVGKMDKAGNEVYFYPIKGVGHFLWRNGHYWQIAKKAKKRFFKKLGYITEDQYQNN